MANPSNGTPKAKKPRVRARRKTPDQAVQMRVPKHGYGLLRVGNPENAGGGRHPDVQRQQARDLVDLLFEEVRARLRDKKYPITWNEIAQTMAVLARVGLPSQFEVSGPGGAGIPFEQAREELVTLLQKRMGGVPKPSAN